VLRAVVFDFDGVIADSEPLHYRGFRDVLDRQGIELREHDYYSRYLGYDDAGTFRAIAGDRGLAWSADQIAELIASKARILEKLEADGSLLFPGAEAAIRRVGEAVPLAIASGAARSEIRRILDRRSLSSTFRVIVAAEDTRVSKPAPDPYVLAVELLGNSVAGLVPAECVAIEDSAWGLESARRAGLHTIAVTHTYDRSALDAEIVISSLDELTVATLQQLCGV
jgi:beta-phosphoglucomutase